MRLLMKITFLIFIFLTPILRAYDFDYYYNAISERLSSQKNAEEDSELYEELYTLYNRPISINDTREKKLKEIPLLDNRTVNIIMKASEKNKFKAVKELVTRNIISEEIFLLIEPFVTTLPPAQKHKKKFHLLYHTVFHYQVDAPEESNVSVLRLSQSPWITNGLNNPDKFYKIRHFLGFEISDSAEGAIILERDPYEKQFPDLIKGSVEMNFSGITEKVCIGAINVHFGQRILFSSSLRGTGPYAESPISYKKSSKISASKGAGENYLFGAGTKLITKKLTIIPFAGFFNYDSEVLNAHFGDASPYVTTLGTYQSHETEADLRKKNTQKEYTGGIDITYHINQHSHAGFSTYGSLFKYPVLPEKNSRTSCDFFGKEVFGFSGNWLVRKNHTVYYGETALHFTPYKDNPEFYSPTDRYRFKPAPAIYAGIAHEINRELQFQSGLRYYDNFLPDLHQPGFAGSKVKGETGSYTGFKFKPNRNIALSFFTDIYQKILPGNFEPIDIDTGILANWKIIDKLRMKTEISYDTEAIGLKTSFSFTGQKFYMRAKSLNEFSGKPYTNQSSALYFDFDIYPVKWITIKTRYLLFNAPHAPLYTGYRNVSKLMTGLNRLAGSGFAVEGVLKFNIKENIGIEGKYYLLKKKSDPFEKRMKKEEIQVALWLKI